MQQRPRGVYVTRPCHLRRRSSPGHTPGRPARPGRALPATSPTAPAREADLPRAARRRVDVIAAARTSSSRTCATSPRDAFRHRLVLTYQALAEEVDARRSSTPCSPRCLCRRSTSRARASLELDRRIPAARGGRPTGPGPGRSPAACCGRSTSHIAPPRRGAAGGRLPLRCARPGSELAQVRPYVPGDDVRQIEWNVTARTGEPHVRIQLAERVLVTWLVLDTSPSMQFGTADRRKADVAEGVAIAVGHVASRRGNRLGIVTFGDAHPQALPPRQGRVGLLGLLAALREEPAEGEVGATSLGEAMRADELARAPARARRRRLRLPRAARLAPSAARAVRPPRRRRRRDPRPARAGASERRRALPRRSGDRPAAARRHPERQAPRPLRGGCSGRAARAAPRARVRRHPPHRALDLGGLAPLPGPVPEARPALSFASPTWLLAFIAVPVLIALYVLYERRRARYGERFANPDLLPNVVGRTPGKLRHLPLLVLLAGLVAMVIGVARPHATVTVPREEATVMLAIDTSRSMQATDIKPSRLGAAVKAANESWPRSRRSSASASSPSRAAPGSACRPPLTGASSRRRSRACSPGGHGDRRAADGFGSAATARRTRRPRTEDSRRPPC